jgi:hypothetical protein
VIYGPIVDRLLVIADPVQNPAFRENVIAELEYLLRGRSVNLFEDSKLIMNVPYFPTQLWA